MAQPFKRILLIDFETRYALKPQDWCPLGEDLQRKAYTLSKMTNEEYVRSKCFKAFGASLKWFAHDAPATQWYGHGELPRIFQTINWDETAVVAHNAQFDVSVLSWRYGIQPAFIFDTLSMARALRGVHGKNSLAAIAEDFGLPAKGTAIGLSDGVFDLEDVPGLERKLAEYCNHDVFLLEEIFKRFLAMHGRPTDNEGAGGLYAQMYDQKSWTFPKKELRLVDMTLRMYTRPLLELDTTMLEEAIGEEAETRTMLLHRLGVTDGDLASNDRFAEILRGLGVEPPTKKKRPTAKTPNPVGVNFAFAKTDALFQAMLNGDDENISMLCEARLKVKSTTERTRAQRFVDIAARGPLPVPLSYFGAGTGRWTACLVADTEVTVYDRHNGQCKKRIVDVLPDDLVWDGIEFVQHEGVQFSGYREVMTHDGVTGTEDHKVFIDETTSLRLAEAAERGARIMDAPEPGCGAVEAARARLKRLRW
jgi:hypothetical protein